MADFAIIPPPLYEQLNGEEVTLKPSEEETQTEILSAKYQYFDDRVAMQESGD
jgi:hypothetical protein